MCVCVCAREFAQIGCTSEKNGVRAGNSGFFLGWLFRPVTGALVLGQQMTRSKTQQQKRQKQRLPTEQSLTHASKKRSNDCLALLPSEEGPSSRVLLLPVPNFEYGCIRFALPSFTGELGRHACPLAWHPSRTAKTKRDAGGRQGLFYIDYNRAHTAGRRREWSRAYARPHGAAAVHE